MTRARSLSKLSNPSVFTVDTDNNLGINSTSPVEKVNVVGVVSATSFFGDGTGLTGVASTDNIITSGIVTITNATNSTSSTTGALKVTGGIGVGLSMTVGGNLSVGGTLTYEDVTNVDSLGIVTARGGFEIGASGVGGTITAAGAAEFVGIVTVKSDVSIADKIIHTGDTNTAIRFPAADTFTVETAGSERLRVDSSGRLLQGKSATKGSTGENVPTYCTEIVSVNPNVLEIANNGTGSSSYSALVLSRSDGSSVNSHTAVDSGDKIGEVCFIGADGADRFNTAASVFVEAEADFTANDCPARLILATNAGGASVTERLRITSTGGFHFTNGELIERAKVTAGKLSDNTNIDLENGMVHLFTTQETTTSTPNIRINSSTSLNSVMATGEMISVTLITTAAAGAYSAQLTIDGGAVTENWTGGSAPSDGGSSGVDIHAYTIIKTADATFTVVATQTKTS